jgi:uncharacterized protein with FMN-binding domain
MSKKKRRWIIGLAILAVLAAVFFVGGTRGLEDARNVPLQGIGGALPLAADGEYQGSYRNGRFSNTVAVTVKDHRIAEIEIVDGMMISLFTDELFQKVVEAQETRIDAVSGATATGRAYLKAIENAVAGGE